MYLILDCISNNNPQRNPSLINYKTDLTVVLKRTETIMQGRLLRVDYFHPVSGLLVLDVIITYNDSTGDPAFPLSRTTTRCWYDEDGDTHEAVEYDKTTKTKYYNPQQSLTEGQRRRKTIIEHLFMMSVSLGYVTEAQDRIKAVSNLIDSYKLVGDTAIIDDVTNTPETWLDDVFPPESPKTLRTKMIETLTI